MSKMTIREQLIKDTGGKTLYMFNKISLIFVLFMIASPFVFIWDTMDLALKVFFTGIVGFSISVIISNLIEKTIAKVVDQEIKNYKPEPKPKSKFHQKLNDLMEEHNNLNN